MGRAGAPQEDPVAEREEEAHGVQVDEPPRGEVPGDAFREAPPRVPPVVADCFVERGVEPGMGGSHDDEMAAGLEAAGGPGELGEVVGDVLQDVDVEDAVEERPGREGREISPGCLASNGKPARANRGLDLAGQHGVGLEADPGTLAPVAERPCRRPKTRANLQHVALEESRKEASVVGLPVLGPRENVELGADVSVFQCQDSTG
jgi:hypothetical protein